IAGVASGPEIVTTSYNGRISPKLNVHGGGARPTETKAEPLALVAEADSRGGPSEQTLSLPAAEAAALTVSHRVRLQSALQTRIMAELGFTEPLNPDQPLNDAGLDSLRSVALANGLEKEFGIPISVAVLIKGPSINELADYLVDELAGMPPARPKEGHPATTPSATPITMSTHRRIASDADEANANRLNGSCSLEDSNVAVLREGARE